jgi:LDH2 family malate/lactate/ureidoglycolate dehydrogenase
MMGEFVMAEQDVRVETRFLVEIEPFIQWMTDVLMSRGFDRDEASDAGSWAAQTASYEVETHGARKLFHLLDHEFARSGSCVPQAKHEVLLPLPPLEVWDGRKKLGPAIARMAQARSVEMAVSQGMGVVFVRDCNHFGWGPAYALELLTDELLIGNACQGAIPIVTPIGGRDASIGSNAIAIAMNTGVEACPVFVWDTGTAAMSWGEVQKLCLEDGTLRPGAAVDAQGEPAVLANDAVSLLPAGTIGNALGILMELLAANVGAGDPHLRSEPTGDCPDGEPNTCVFIFFAFNLAVFDTLGFPNGRSRKDNVTRMVEAIFKDNGSARMVGLRKWQAKQRSDHYGGLLFAPESIVAFKEEAAARGIAFPDRVSEIEVSVEQIAVAGK